MIIQELDLFGGIDDSIVEKIVGVMETESYETGDVVFKAGDRADDFYILVSGSVNLYMAGTAKTATVALKQGDAFGWSSLAGRDVYSSAVECAEASRLYRINKEARGRMGGRWHAPSHHPRLNPCVMVRESPPPAQVR